MTPVMTPENDPVAEILAAKVHTCIHKQTVPNKKIRNCILKVHPRSGARACVIRPHPQTNFLADLCCNGRLHKFLTVLRFCLLLFSIAYFTLQMHLSVVCDVKRSLLRTIGISTAV